MVKKKLKIGNVLKNGLKKKLKKIIEIEKYIVS